MISFLLSSCQPLCLASLSIFFSLRLTSFVPETAPRSQTLQLASNEKRLCALSWGFASLLLCHFAVLRLFSLITFICPSPLGQTVRVAFCGYWVPPTFFTQSTAFILLSVFKSSLQSTNQSYFLVDCGLLLSPSPHSSSSCGRIPFALGPHSRSSLPALTRRSQIHPRTYSSFSLLSFSFVFSTCPFARLEVAVSIKSPWTTRRTLAIYATITISPSQMSGRARRLAAAARETQSRHPSRRRR